MWYAWNANILAKSNSRPCNNYKQLVHRALPGRRQPLLSVESTGEHFDWNVDMMSDPLPPHLLPYIIDSRSFCAIWACLCLTSVSILLRLNFLSLHPIRGRTQRLWPLSPLPLLLSLNPITTSFHSYLLPAPSSSISCFLYLFIPWWFVSFSTFVPFRPFFSHLLNPASAPLLSSYISFLVMSVWKETRWSYILWWNTACDGGMCTIKIKSDWTKQYYSPF